MTVSVPKHIVVPEEFRLEAQQGADFSHVFRWATDTVVQKPVTAITQAAPPALSVASHGLVAGWPFWVEDVKGMWQINNPFGCDETPDRDPYVGAVPDANTITIPGVSSIGYSAYTSGGAVLYFSPQDLTGFTAKFDVLRSAGQASLLEVTQAAGIALDNTAKAITVSLTAAQTALLPASGLIYRLLLISAGGVVTRLAEGRFVVHP